MLRAPANGLAPHEGFFHDPSESPRRRISPTFFIFLLVDACSLQTCAGISLVILIGLFESAIWFYLCEVFLRLIARFFLAPSVHDQA
jgi:hypothetical protein